MTYQEYIDNKIKFTRESGFDIEIEELNPILFDYQKDLIKWSLKLGKSALFTMTGTGKSYMEIEWSWQVYKKTKGNVIIITPLAVSNQMIEMAKVIGIEINNMRHNKIKSGLNIINYEQLSKIDASEFIGVVLDESSILKNFTGKIKNDIIDMFKNTQYKLCGTATPSPNDYIELGNHAEFLDVMKRSEMLSMFFINDASDTGQWRMKGHAVDKFWQWVSSWAAILTKPSDLDYDDSKFILPLLKTYEIIIETGIKLKENLFSVAAETLEERREARRLTISEKVKRLAEMINNSDDIWLVWCDLNIESDLCKKNIKNSVEIKGSDSDEFKEKNILDFAHGNIKCLITKPSIAGHGINWQVCHNMAFVGLSDSFEAYFQAVRRCYRFGQKKEVNVYIMTSDIEGNVLQNIKDKEKRAMQMISGMVEHTKNYVKNNIKEHNLNKTNYYANDNMVLPEWLC